jgi:hypothetical protein
MVSKRKDGELVTEMSSNFGKKNHMFDDLKKPNFSWSNGLIEQDEIEKQTGFMSPFSLEDILKFKDN